MLQKQTNWKPFVTKRSTLINPYPKGILASRQAKGHLWDVLLCVLCWPWWSAFLLSAYFLSVSTFCLFLSAFCLCLLLAVFIVMVVTTLCVSVCQWVWLLWQIAEGTVWSLCDSLHCCFASCTNCSPSQLPHNCLQSTQGPLPSSGCHTIGSFRSFWLEKVLVWSQCCPGGSGWLLATTWLRPHKLLLSPWGA